MTCVNNLPDTLNRANSVLRSVFPYADGARSNSPEGRREVRDWVMNTITSDAPLHQARADFNKAGVVIKPEENFIDAYGSVGNVIASMQRNATHKVIHPMVGAFKATFDTLGVKDAHARKLIMEQVGELRTALHALERAKAFANLKAAFAEDDSPESIAKAKAARKARRDLHKKFLSGELDDQGFLAALDELVAKYPLDKNSVAGIGGMHTSVAQGIIDQMRSKPHVSAVYDATKDHIDAVFEHIQQLARDAGKIDPASERYIKLYNFQHYVPTMAAHDAEYLNQSSAFDVGTDMLEVAKGGIVTDRIPMFPAMHIALNSAAKSVAENNAALKLEAFAQAHGESFGIKTKPSRPIYELTDIGHDVKDLRLPEFSVPVMRDGKVTVVTFTARGNKANLQLFNSIKARLTQNFNTTQSGVDKAVQNVVTTAPARLFTNLNPQFWFNSFIRDPLHVMTNVVLDPRIKNKREVLSRTIDLMLSEHSHKRAVTHYQSSDAARMEDTSAFASWLHDLADRGGESHFNRTFYASDYLGVGAHGDPAPYDLGGSRTSSVGAVKDTLAEAGELLIHKTGNLVTAFDMQARVSVYRALVEAGAMDADKAAAVVREFMDFSQRPINSTVFHTLIPFFRTSMSAGYRMVDTLLYNENGDFAPQWKPIAAMIALGMVAALGGAGDDDDDGIPFGDKVAASKDFASITVGFTDDNRAITVPLPYGAPAIFVGLGKALHRATNGMHDPYEVLESYTLHATKNLMPLQLTDTAAPSDSFGDALLSGVAGLNPILGEVNNLVGNRDNFGKPIYSDAPRDEGTVDAYAGLAKTPSFYKDLAAFLYDNGGVDMHPETIEELLINWTPLSIGRTLDTQLKKDERLALGSDEPYDMENWWTTMASGVVIDKTASMYSANQFRKAMATLNDIKHRAEMGYEISTEADQFKTLMQPYVSTIARLNAAMRSKTPEQKYELLLERRQVEELAARAAAGTLRENKVLE